MCRRILRAIENFGERFDAAVEYLEAIVRLLTVLTKEVAKMTLNTDRLASVVAAISVDAANLSNLYTNAAASQIAAAVAEAKKAQEAEDQGAIDEAFSKLDTLRQQLENNQPITPAPTPTNPSPDPTPVPSPAQNATDTGGGASDQSQR